MMRSSQSLPNSGGAFLGESEEHVVGRESGDTVREMRGSDETPFVNDAESLSGGDSDEQPKAPLTRAEERKKWWKVYLLYLLFLWNSNLYEYASVFLVSLASPKSLFATSIRGMASTISIMLCASGVGSYIDRAPSRLSPLLIMISFNHCAIVAAYVCWLFWPLLDSNGDDDTRQGPFSSLSKGALFGFLVLLDVVQDLSVIGIRLSIERDWVSVLVEPSTDTESAYGLTEVNSVMKRIGLITKLVAPSLLPLIVSLFKSRIGWVILLGGAAIIFWALEVWCACIISKENSQLRLLKPAPNDPATVEDHDIEEQYRHLKPGLYTWVQKLYFVCYRDPLVRFRHYFSMNVWPASISVSMLQMTVLAYSATLITYLLGVGFSLSAITIARASGNVSALAGTFITPMAVGYLRRRNTRQSRSGQEGENDGGEARIVRTVGFWGVISQFLCEIPVVIVLWNLSPNPTSLSTSRDTSESSSASHNLIIHLIIFSFLSFSQIGHWMYILMVQELEQVEIPSSQRSTFAGTEQSLSSFFELCHWAATVVWSQPEDFRWLALGSVIVLGVGTTIFGIWSGKMRMETVEARYEEIAMGDVESEVEVR